MNRRLFTIAIISCLSSTMIAEAQGTDGKTPTPPVANPAAPSATQIQAQSAFQAGVSAYRKSDLATAETELGKAAAAAPENGDIQGWYGFILLKRNKPGDSIPYLEKAIALKPQVADHCTNLGNALLLKPGRTAADTTRALEVFKKATVIDPASGEAQFNLGLAYTRLGRSREAALAYRQATVINPKDDRAFLSLGQTYIGLGDYDNASVAFRTVSVLTPQKPDVWTSLGIAESKRLRPDRQMAINALETARKLDGGNAQTLTLLGKLYAEAGQTEASAEAFGVAADQLGARSAPETAAVRYNQAVMLAKLGKTDESLAAYEKSLALKPDYFDPAFNAGTLLYKAGRYPEASAKFELATRSNPKSAMAWTNYGLALSQQSDESGTIAAWKRAANLKSDDYVTRDALAGIYMRRKNYDDAIALYKQMARIRPASGTPWNALGLAYQRKGENESSITAFQTATKKEPKLAAAYNNLGVVYEKRAQFKLAIAAYKKALAVDPNFADARANLARYGTKTSAANP
ncbi:MAG: tetratricopeptide repeat protein [Akkermansiaceae bacterium]|nr:tetratricopeptide repeat protein [Armatimonadota bacterium]